jgi:hypothetical protein
MVRKKPKQMSRREFIKLAAMAGLLARCRQAEQVMITATPAPTNSPVRTATGKVVQAQHTGVWSGENLEPGALRQMLDASITTLTGVNDATEAWAFLFDPGERIAIKVNTIATSDYWTHPPLVTAVAERLIESGVPAEQIVIFDRSSRELEGAGYEINRDGPGVRCYGTDTDYSPGWFLMDREIELSDILLNCDALINIPILKQHGHSGISFAFKNHYGTLDRPAVFHRPRIDTALGELNALPEIRDRTRLIIGDVLSLVQPGWFQAWEGDSILMSFDPVAHDIVGLNMITEAFSTDDNYPGIPSPIHANSFLQHSADLGLGTNNPEEIVWSRLELG